MKCDICGIKEAVMFIQQVSGDTSKELHLCTECAKAKGFSVQNEKLEVSLNKFFSEIDENRACRVCGQKLANIKKYRNVGCPQCYKEFSAEISTMLKKNMVPDSAGTKNEADIVYRGSLPRQLSQYRSLLEDRAELQNRLNESIANEDYEKAAVYRDRLKELEAGNE